MKEEPCVTSRDTTDRMGHGHELWLEMASSHSHAGGSADLYVKWGHNLRVDGLARKEGLTALVVAPNGEQAELPVADGGPDYYTLRLATPLDGFYHVVAKNTGSYVLDKEGRHYRGTRRDHPDAARVVFYNQYAQVFLPVGHDLEGVPHQAGIPLEIVPEAWRQWRAGAEIGLQRSWMWPTTGPAAPGSGRK
jgi:hypothetical protein